MRVGKKSLSNCRFSLCYKAKRTVGFSPMAYNVLQLGDRFVKRWHCAFGQTAANVLLGDRYFLCGGIYEY